MIVPPSDLLQGLEDIWPYLVGGVGIAVLIGIAIPVKKKEDIKTIVKEEIQNDVKIVTKIHKREVAIDYDIFLKMLQDYEKAKQNAQKELLTQLALIEAKKEQERDKQLRDMIKLDDAYKDIVKVKINNNNGKKVKKDEEDEDEEVEIDTSQLQ